jgi:2-dehydro-3-deoxygalactonokinase
MIAVDWGTTSCRAYRLHGGKPVDRRDAPAGILHVEQRDFSGTLRSLVAAWLADGEERILLAGMVGSRSGWVETGYLPCPVSPAQLAESVVPIPFEGAAVRVVPGVSAVDTARTPELMRGEEVQIFGAEIEAGTVCLPGSHSKWARVRDGRITDFGTYLTGESFAALRGHTILARTIVDGPLVVSAFDAGVMRSADPGGLLHHLFGVRALSLAGQLTEASSGSYLSGLLIGHEVRAALSPGNEVHVIGAAHLTALYERAIVACGGRARVWAEDTAARGLNRIGESVRWT